MLREHRRRRLSFGHGVLRGTTGGTRVPVSHGRVPLIEDVAFTEVVPREDGDYGLFIRNDEAWILKLEPDQATGIRDALPTAPGGEVHLTIDTTNARPL